MRIGIELQMDRRMEKDTHEKNKYHSRTKDDSKKNNVSFGLFLSPSFQFMSE